MTRIYVHSKHPTPQLVAHKGVWTWELPDGTYFIGIGHDDPADARVQASNHPDILDVAPSRTSGKQVGPTMLNAVHSMINKHPNGKNLKKPDSMTTHELLDRIFTVTGDSAFHPDSSL